MREEKCQDEKRERERKEERREEKERARWAGKRDWKDLQEGEWVQKRLKIEEDEQSCSGLGIDRWSYTPNCERKRQKQKETKSNRKKP